MADIKAGSITIQIILDTSKFQKAAKRAQAPFAGLEKGFSRVGKAAAIAGVAIGIAITAFSAKAIASAADATETLNLLGETFGKSAKDVVDFTKTVASETGRSRFELQELAGQLGAVTVALLGNREAGAKLTKQFIQLAVDVASFRNLSEPDVIRKFQSALVGETEAIKSLGVVMTQTALANFALNEGFGDLKNLNEASKTQLRAEFILDALSDANGDAVKTSAGFANQQRRLTSQIRDLTTSIGQELLPVSNLLITSFNELLGGAADNETAMRDLVRRGVLLVIDVFGFAVDIGFRLQKSWIRIQIAAKKLKSVYIESFRDMAIEMDFFLEAIGDVAKKFPSLAQALGIDAEKIGSALDDTVKSLQGSVISANKEIASLGGELNAITSRQENFNAKLQATKGILIETSEAARMAAEQLGKMKAGLEPPAKPLVPPEILKGLKNLRKEAESAAFGIEEFLDPAAFAFTGTAADAQERLRGIAEQMRTIAAEAPTTAAGIEMAKEAIAGLSAEEDRLRTAVDLSRAADMARREQAVETASTIAVAFGAAFGALVTGEQTAEQAFKSFARTAISAVINVAEKQILAAAAKGAAESGSAVAGIPVIGPVLVPAAIAGTFALIRGLLGKFQAGGKVEGGRRGTDSVGALLTPGEVVLPVPLVRSLEQVFGRGGVGGGFQDGGRVERGGGAAINVTIQTTTLPDQAELDNMIRTRIVPSLQRLRGRGFGGV